MNNTLSIATVNGELDPRALPNNLPTAATGNRDLGVAPLLEAHLLRVSELATIVEQLEDALAEVTATQHQASGAVSEHEVRLRSLAQRMTRQVADLDDLRAASAVASTDTLARAASFETQIGGLAAEHRAIRTALDSQAESLEQLTHSAKRFEAVAGEVRQQVTTLAAAVDTLTRQVHELAAGQERLGSHITGLRQALLALSNSFEKLKRLLLWSTWRRLLRRHPGPDLGELIAGRWIEQVLDVSSPGLAGVVIQVGTFRRTNACAVRVRLREGDSDRDLRVATVEGRYIQDNSWAAFTFVPLTQTGQFRLILDSPDGLPGCAVTAFRDSGTGLRVNGRDEAGCLRHRLIFGPCDASSAPTAEASPTGTPVGQDTGRAKSDQSIGTGPTELPQLHVWCDMPPLGQAQAPTLSGLIQVQGWAVARKGVAQVDMLLDGQVVSEAGYGLSRPDVACLYPEFPEAERSGFSGCIDVRTISAGIHELSVRLRDQEGGVVIQSGSVIVDPHHIRPAMMPDYTAQYQNWLKEHWPSPETLGQAKREIGQWTSAPVVSVIIAADRESLPHAWKTIDSVMAQVYPHWELCISYGAGADEQFPVALESRAAGEPRMRLVRNGDGATAELLQAALHAASGEFVVKIDPGDELWPHALYEAVRRLNEKPDTDALYSDEDRVSADGKRSAPTLKPDWSPQLLLSTDYVTGFLIMRRSLALSAGGYRLDASSAAAYDLALRLTEQARRVEHVATVLCSRSNSGSHSTAGSPMGDSAHLQVATEAAGRRGWQVSAAHSAFPGVWTIRRKAQSEPLVSIVVPTGGTRFLGRCIRSVITRTRYTNYEVLVVDNSPDEAVAALCAQLGEEFPRIQRLENKRKPFNYSALNNFGVQRTSGELICLLNDDTEIIEPDWLNAMVELAELLDVGVVGARLLYENGTIQHAGTVLGIGGVANHAFRGSPYSYAGYLGLAAVVRETSAVTFACALVRRDAWNLCGGLDEVNLPVSFNDIDFCLRAREKGYRVLYTPHATLIHYESATRGVEQAELGSDYMFRRWGALIARDPYYNRHLTRTSEDYSLAVVA